ncbi:MAG: TolC family protein [Treponema sp.]|jgi:hypothetical protein|nr:TolC family protein [Treponema sp.]
MKKIKNYYLFLYSLLFITVPLFSLDQQNTLKNILESLSLEKGMVNAKRTYDLALLDQRYYYLQWWRPSIIIGNDLVYPYKKDAFDDLATSDTTSLNFSLPFYTGSTFDFSVGYGINRGMTELQKWGFTQNIQGKIGIEQSLNPWWLYTRINPYKSGASLQTAIAKTEYNISMKNNLYSCIKAYIDLRKTERSIFMLREKIALYDDMIMAYRQSLYDGIISIREFQNIRKDKWEYEQALFNSEQNIMALSNELYQRTGVQIETISNENLIDLTDDIWLSVFLGLDKNGVIHLEQTGYEFQKNRLQIEKLITLQNSAPFIKLEFGSSFLLPIQESNALNESWKKENFNDNELNNWSINLSINLSSFFSPVNKKYRLEQRITENALNSLSKKIQMEKETEKAKNNAMIQLLETDINHLSVIVDNELALSEDLKVLFERGNLHELDYRQTLLEYKEKKFLLDNYNDDLWFYKFLETFFY